MQLELLNIAVGFGRSLVIDDLTLALEPGEIGCLLGASGCGKTTALRAIAGFEPLARGQIVVGDRQLSRPGLTLPPQQRRVGMVFQDYALFPHLSAADNVAFGLRGVGAASGWPTCSTWWGWLPWPTTTPTSCRGGSNSGWPWPGPWPPTRRYC